MSALPQFPIQKLFETGSQNQILLGNRRCGKSFMAAHILKIHRNKFDVAISFLGTPYCNDEVTQIVSKHYDARLNFTEFSPKTLDVLWNQQNRLLSQGVRRRVCLIFDDVFTSSPHHLDVLTRLFMRGRHCLISCIFCCVSVSLIPKNIRRCADHLFVFSVLTGSDQKLLTDEYVSAKNKRVGIWSLRNLQKFECLVLGTTGQNQKLFVYSVKTSQSQADIESLPLERDSHREVSTTHPLRTIDGLDNEIPEPSLESDD